MWQALSEGGLLSDYIHGGIFKFDITYPDWVTDPEMDVGIIGWNELTSTDQQNVVDHFGGVDGMKERLCGEDWDQYCEDEDGYESKAKELQHDEYEVDVDEYIETGEPVEKLPKDKRKYDSLNFDPSYEAETSDAEYEDWSQNKTDEDTTRNNLEKLQEETVEESFGDCGCKMTNKAKETWEVLTDSDKQLELRDMGVDEGYAYYPFEHLPKKIGEAFVDKFNTKENGDSLGWNKITALERADTLRKIGFTPRDSELVSNLEYQQLSESLKKDVNEALNYKVKAQESQVPQDKSQEKFENGLYSNMYDGYLERRGARVDSKKKAKILENNNFGLDISKVKGVEATVTKDIWDNIDDIIFRLTLLERAGYQEDLRTGYYSGKETWDKLAELSNNEVTGALSGVQISEQEIKETTNTGYFPDMFGGRVDRWGDKYEDNDPYVYESKASELLGRAYEDWLDSYFSEANSCNICGETLELDPQDVLGNKVIGEDMYTLKELHLSGAHNIKDESFESKASEKGETYHFLWNHKEVRSQLLAQAGLSDEHSNKEWNEIPEEDKTILKLIMNDLFYSNDYNTESKASEGGFENPMTDEDWKRLVEHYEDWKKIDQVYPTRNDFMEYVEIKGFNSHQQQEQAIAVYDYYTNRGGESKANEEHINQVCPKCGSLEIVFDAVQRMNICWNCGNRFEYATEDMKWWECEDCKFFGKTEDETNKHELETGHTTYGAGMTSAFPTFLKSQKTKSKEHNYLGGVPAKLKNTQCPECGSYDSLYEHETHGDLQCEVCGGAFEWEQVAEFNNVEVSDLGESKANEIKNYLGIELDSISQMIDKIRNGTIDNHHLSRFADYHGLPEGWTKEDIIDEIRVYEGMEDELDFEGREDGEISQIRSLLYGYESKANEKIPLSFKGLKLPRQMDFKTGGYAGMNDWGGEATLCEICGEKFNTYPEFLDHYQAHDEAQGVDFYTESKATERDFYRSNKEISDQGDDIQAEAEFGKKYSELSDSEKGYIEYIKNEFGDVKSYDQWVTSGTEAQVMGTPITNNDKFGREWGFSIINHGYGEGSETPYEVGIFLHDEIHKKNDVKGWLNEEEALYYKAKFEVDPIDTFRSIGGQMDSIINPDFVEQTEDNWNLWESLQDSGEASLSDPDNKKYNMDTDFGFSYSDKDIEALDAETDIDLSVDKEATEENPNRDDDGQFTSDLPEEKNEDYGKNPYSGKVNVPFVEAKESKSKAEEAFDNGASAEKIYSLVDDKGTDDDRSESEEEYLNNLYNKTNANKSTGFSDLQ